MIRRVSLVLGSLVVVVALVAVAADQNWFGAFDRSVADTADPLGARPLYVDPDSPAQRALATATPADADSVRTIAAVPQAHWFTESTPVQDVAAAVARYVGGATAAGATPVVVVYAIPGRDCGGFSDGGFGNPQDYRDWIRQVRVGIGGHPAAVVVEPDALVSLDCLDAAGQATRYDLLRDAVTVLAADPGTAVYVDGGHSRWLTAAELAIRLRLAGVAGARGFSLNVSNFFTTAEEVAYGEGVSDALGGKHYVVDTSRNGAGPAPDGPLNWCNPPGRTLGGLPTTDPAGKHADAYLWIKNPGQSDGSCDRGDPTSGVWFAAYAQELVARR